jgi:hypothetical protein
VRISADLAVVEHHAADQLHVEVAHPEARLTHCPADGKRLGQEALQGSAVLQPRPELAGLGRQFRCGQALDVVGQRIDHAHDLLVALDGAIIATAEQLAYETSDHGNPRNE